MKKPSMNQVALIEDSQCEIAHANRHVFNAFTCNLVCVMWMITCWLFEKLQDHAKHDFDDFMVKIPCDSSVVLTWALWTLDRQMGESKPCLTNWPSCSAARAVWKTRFGTTKALQERSSRTVGRLQVGWLHGFYHPSLFSLLCKTCSQQNNLSLWLLQSQLHCLAIHQYG